MVRKGVRPLDGSTTSGGITPVTSRYVFVVAPSSPRWETKGDSPALFYTHKSKQRHDLLARQDILMISQRRRTKVVYVCTSKNIGMYSAQVHPEASAVIGSKAYFSLVGPPFPFSKAVAKLDRPAL
jgi:hypothetical protein